MKFITKKTFLLSFLQIFISLTTFGQFVSPSQYFHDTQGNIDINEGGQLQFTLPIDLPPGVKNVSPQVSLVYLSGAANGTAGYGWNISGITSISRIGKNIEKDGEYKGVQLDYSDYYSFNGQRLILKSGEYGKDGAEYITEKYSNTKIKSLGSITGQSWSGPEYWEVTLADGSQAWYGATAGGSSTARTPLEYNIVKWKDPQGNYISYDYLQGSGTNVSLISSIKWGGNESLGKAHYNEVQFIYNGVYTRQIVEQSYVNGIALIQDKLLNSIVSKTNNQQYRKYDITYKLDVSKYQFVDKIQEFNGDNQPSNPIEFHRNENQSNTTGSVSDGTWTAFHEKTLSGDFRGVHVTDFILYKNASGGDPAGYYLHFGGDFHPKYYLGTENVYNGAIAVTIKDANNYTSSRQGFVSYTVNSTNKDITLKYYLVDMSKPISYTGSGFLYPNALTLVGTKVIGGNQWDESESDFTNPFDTYQKTSSIKKLIPYDIDGDGVSEVIFEKNNNVTNRICTVPENQFPTEDDCQTYTYDTSKYFVIKQQDSTFPFFEFDLEKSENLLFGDFNGDGVDDIAQSFHTSYSDLNGESVPKNTLYAYNLKKNSQGNFSLNEVFSAEFLGLSTAVQIADFNGDGLSDLFVRTNVNNHYVINLNTGKNFEKSAYFNDFNGTYSLTESQYGNYSTARVLDINADGKSDIIDFSTSYNIASPTSASSSFTIKVRPSQGYANGKIQFGSDTPVTNNYNAPLIYREIVGLRQNELYLYRPSNSNVGAVNNYYHYSNLQKAVVERVNQAGRGTLIGYNGGSSASWGCTECYQPVKNEQYPFMELANVNTQLVSSIHEWGNQPNSSRFKLFRYRGLIMNLHNRKSLGFRQIASSSWNTAVYPGYALLNTHIWSGVETDPLQQGATVKEWSVRTNDETKIFPVDISENNNQLLSFKSTVYQNDKLLNGQVVSTVNDASKANVVNAILPKITRAKDFLTGAVSETTVTYGDYYLPVQTVSKLNTSYAVKTATYLYTNNPAGIGANYYIGRASSKNETVEAYNDLQSNKEEYSYDNNNLKTVKKWNRDNSGYLLDTFSYDGFGNIIQKVTSNSIDAGTQTSGKVFDATGRFVEKQTDNLNLETNSTYNTLGQLQTQTDPFGIVTTNTYDGWGKILTSASNIGGTTTYQYDKDTKYNVTLTQEAADGNVTKTFTNEWGQIYKKSSKAFAQGQLVSKETKYDILGRKIAESEPYFDNSSPTLWNVITYDANTYPAKVTTTGLATLNSTGAITSFLGKKVETVISGVTSTTTELNNYNKVTSKTSDVLGNVISTTDKGGTIQFSYNAAGQQIKARYGENSVVTKYDVWGRKSEYNDPSNGLYKYEFDGLGRAKKTISPKGTKEFTYNNLGQLISQTEFSTIDSGQTTNKTISFGYNTKGQLTSKSGMVSGGAFSNAFTFDTYGRPLSSTENSNGKTYLEKNIIYDSKGRISSYEKELQSAGITTNVKIENVYSPWNGELYQLKEKNTGKILWELQSSNSKGQALTAKLGGINILNTYNEATGFLTEIKHSSPVQATVLNIKYTFDAVKNELKSRETLGDFNITESFTYDENNRLINWTDPRTGQLSQNSYDVKGRILQNDQVGTMKYENQSKIYQATGMTLNAAGTQNYSGDLIQTIVYNENNDPVQINGEKDRVSFKYGLGSMRQRVDITKLTQIGGGDPGDPPVESFSTAENSELLPPVWQVQESKFYNDDGSFEVVFDQTTNQEKHIIYVAGSPYDSNIIFLKNYSESTGSFKFLHKDYLGSILAITDEAGTKLEQRHYDAWGNFTHLKIGAGAIMTDKALLKSVDLLIDRGYTSHEHFMQVGIVHMNGRLYDPLLRRFLNADENIQDPTNTQNYNKYGYVMNNPLLYNDPSGEFWGWFIGMLVGSYISGVQANHGQVNPVKWDWKNTWTSVVGGAFAGAALGQGISNISVYGTKFVQNSVVGAVGSIFNGLATGQNIFKSALVGFSGISYSFNIGGNNITATEGMADRFKYIISPDYNQGSSDLDMLAGYMPLTKEIYAQYILGRGRGQLSGSDENFLGHMFEKVFIDWAQLNIGPNVKDNTIGKNYFGTVPDATSPLAYETNYVPDGVFYEVKNTFRNIGISTAQIKREMNALSINNLTHGIPGGVMVIASPAGVNLTGPLMGYARNLNIDLVHFFSMYKMDGNLMRVSFVTTSIINLFNTAIRLGGTSVPAYKTPN